MIFELARRNIMGPAIDGDLVAAGNKTSRQMFREGFKTAVAGWYATGSKKGYTHSVWGNSPPPVDWLYFLQLPARHTSWLPGVASQSLRSKMDRQNRALLNIVRASRLPVHNR